MSDRSGREELGVEVLPDAEAVAVRAAELIASEAGAVIAARGRFLLATSGGRTPWKMLEILAEANLPWEHVHLFQVDERVAPAGDPARNLTRLRDSLLNRVAIPEQNVHSMPVEADDLPRAARKYSEELHHFAGDPPALDLIHLGLGADGHTASLVPDDPVLRASGDVAISETYQGHRRMTLTFPLLSRARSILWVVTGADKRDALAKLLAGDASIPASHVEAKHAVILADRDAIGDI